MDLRLWYNRSEDTLVESLCCEDDAQGCSTCLSFYEAFFWQSALGFPEQSLGLCIPASPDVVGNKDDAAAKSMTELEDETTEICRGKLWVKGRWEEEDAELVAELHLLKKLFNSLSLNLILLLLDA